MQPGQEIGDNLNSYERTSIRPSEPFKPYSQAVRIGVTILAWLIPGAGHLALGRIKRGLLFLFLLGGSFFFGIHLYGRLFTPIANDPQVGPHFDLISLLWTFAQLGTGLCYFVSHLVGLGTVAHPEAVTYEYGNTFMFLAGLLNYLVAVDVFDIAAGRKG